MILFILKSTACLLVFFGFYKLVLEQENMHLFKRFYLLGALTLSIIIPLITFTTYVEISPIKATLINTNEDLQATSTSFLENMNWSLILWIIYAIGLFVFGFRFIKNLYQLDYKIRRNPKKKDHNFTNVLLKDLIIPHTFFNYIFFNEEKYEAKEIPKEVFWHEQTHAKQKHSIDVLFIELLQVIFWFNPLFYIYNHLVKLNHEFLADQGVLNKGVKPKTYQERILAFSSNAQQPILASALNYSLIKKRFTVMKTKTTRKAFWIRSFVLLPLLAIMLYSFSSREVIEKDFTIANDLIPEESYFNELESFAQEGATKAQIKEYNTLAKKLNYDDSRKEEYIINKNDVERVKYLYGLMTDAQKASAQPFPNIAPPPPTAPKPVRIEVKEVTPPKPPKSKPMRIEVREVPPPPPPVPADATPAQKEKYKEAVKYYKKAVEKAAKVQKEVIRVREINDVERAKVKRMKEQVAVERKVALKERQAEMKLVKEKMAEQRKLQAKEREVLKEQHRTERMDERQAKVILEKLRQVEKKQAQADKERLQVLEKKLRETERRDAAIAEKTLREIQRRQERERAATERVLRQKERIALREIREVPPPPPPKSPIEHIKEMDKKGAIFYLEGKKVSSNKAIKFIKNNENINVKTNHSDSKKPEVHITKNN